MLSRVSTTEIESAVAALDGEIKATFPRNTRVLVAAEPMRRGSGPPRLPAPAGD
jgi:hypothetical protein